MVNVTDMTWSIVAVAGVLGLLIGSAINAIVWRLYVGRKWTRGRSMCPECKHTLAARDLIPVVSWVLLGGRCRYCKQPIHWQYPVVELLTAVVFAVSAYALTPVETVDWLRLGFWLVLATMMLVLAVYDARWLILPDKVMLPLIGVATVYALVMAVAVRDWHVFGGAALAAVVAGGSFLALVYGSKGRAMGGGDIKLAFAMGLMLGVQGLIVAMLLAFNVAAVVGIIMLMLHRRGLKGQIPFGPYLVAGTMVAFWFGRDIVSWYWSINGII